MKNLLLVEPDFPIPAKSKNHKNFLPIGLLKLASHYRDIGYNVKLIRGNENVSDFIPDQVFLTSLFTYWSEYVVESSKYYKQQFPNTEQMIGGVYASLMSHDCEDRTGATIFQGIHKEAEEKIPAYDLVDVDYQIIHTSRGCFRKCKFCGTWIIESGYDKENIGFYSKIDNYDFIAKKSIINEIKSVYPKQYKLVFYDNNLLHNPYFEKILGEIIEFNEDIKKSNRKNKIKFPYLICDSQSGFDGRLMTPEIANMIKKARFTTPRIAWDNKYEDWREVKKQIGLLIDAGYHKKDIYVFMIYNWKYDYKIMEKKRKKCFDLGVQISDCRYRPLNQLYDNYNPRKMQDTSDYHINPNWTDLEVKIFRKNVRRHNICIRHVSNVHILEFERKKVSKREYTTIKELSDEEILAKYQNAWFPNRVNPIPKRTTLDEYIITK